MRDIGDVRLAMEGAFDHEAAGAVASASPPRRRGVPAPLVISLVAVTAFAVWLATRRLAPAPKLSRTSIVMPRSQARTNTGRRGLAVSPDGAHVVYVANEELYLRALDALDARPIEATVGSAPTLPFFSPDGEWIAFYSVREGELQKVALSGGAAVSLCRASNPYGASWARDGTIVFGQGGGGILRVAAGGGTPEVLVSAEEGQSLQSPQMLPGGESVLFTIGQGDWSEGRIVVQSSSSGERRTLVQGGTDGRYLASGHLVYALEGNLLAVPFDLERLEIAGGPVPVAGDVVHAATTGGANFDVSRDGMLVYLTGSETARRTLVWVGREGGEASIPVEPREYSTVRISPDGTRAVLDARDEERDLWVWDFEGETLTRLTFDPDRDLAPVWTPDGRSVVYTAGVLRNLYRRAADGTGVPEPLSESATRQYTMAFTPDGDRLVLLEIAGEGFALAVLTLGREPAVEPLLENRFGVRIPDLSPDGRWLAYDTNASGAFEVYVRPFPDVDAGRWQISSGGGEFPLWGRDGHELFFLTPDGELMRAAIETDPEFRRGNPERIIEAAGYYQGRLRRSFDIAPDGRRFLMLKDVGAGGDDDPYAGLNRIIVVKNWFQELRARAPVD